MKRLIAATCAAATAMMSGCAVMPLQEAQALHAQVQQLTLHEAVETSYLHTLCEQATDLEGRVKRLERMHHLSHERVREVHIYFDLGSAEIRPSETPKLNLVSGLVTKHPGVDVRLVGYTDTVGSAGANKALAERRDEAVRSALGVRHVNVSSSHTMAHGKVHGKNNEKNAHNRRVEIHMHGARPTSSCRQIPLS
jgi:outer membrane protein OmpA-like peptidoglycan-associated protein